MSEDGLTMIDVVLLGTGAMMPLPGRWLSSLLLRANGELVLFDCGEGTQIAWRTAGWSFRRLAAICISHTHADHVSGLPGLLHAVANADRTEPVDLYGPPGTAQVVRGLRVIAPFLPFELRVTELVGGEAFDLPSGLEGTCAAGFHALPVLGYRVSQKRNRQFLLERARELEIPVELWRNLQDGKTVLWSGQEFIPEQVLGPTRAGLAIAYITDTRPTPELTNLARNVDLLVCEGTYGSDEDLAKAARNTHMTFSEAAELARKAGARSLLLTHFSPALENPFPFAPLARSVFPNTTIGTDGYTTSLKFSDEQPA
jgi:ribonuclease Z